MMKISVKLFFPKSKKMGRENSLWIFGYGFSNGGRNALKYREFFKNVSDLYTIIYITIGQFHFAFYFNDANSIGTMFYYANGSLLRISNGSSNGYIVRNSKTNEKISRIIKLFKEDGCNVIDTNSAYKLFFKHITEYITKTLLAKMTGG